MQVIIYHNPRCRKSRAGLEYLKDKGMKPQVKNYLKEGLSIEELKQILSKLHIEPIEIVRTQEEMYKKELKGKEFTDGEWLRIIVDNPKLLKRPIVIRENKAVWGDPAETIEQLF